MLRIIVTKVLFYDDEDKTSEELEENELQRICLEDGDILNCDIEEI